MGKGSDMSEIIKTEEGDDPFMWDQSRQPFVLLLRVTQSNGKQLPIGQFTERTMSQMSHEVAGVVPKEVVIMNDQRVVMELEEETSIMEVSRMIQRLFHWGGQSISVDSLVAKNDLVTEIENVKSAERNRKC